MAPKRKAIETALPEQLQMRPKNGNAPFATYFPSGFNPGMPEAHTKFETYAHEKRKNQYALVAKTIHNVDFVGRNATAEHSSAISCKYALGVYDRTTGKLQVAPVQSGRLLRMEPRAQSLSYEAAAPGTDAGEVAVLERRERNARLVEQFGSQRRKRQLAASKAAQVDATQVSAGDAVLSLIASAGANLGSRDEVIAASLAHRNIPPHDPTARTAADAYNMKDIVPYSVRDALEVRRLFPAASKPEYRAELKAAKTFGEGYVLSRLPVIDTPDQELREERARGLVLLGHLLKLLTGRQGSQIRSKAEEGGVAVAAEKLRMAPSVLEGILDLFYTRESMTDDGGDDKYVLSKEKRGLMLAWALVLAVRVEPHCVLGPALFADLSDELKMRAGEVATLYRELGCVTIRTKAGEEEGIAGYKVTLMPGAAEGEKTLADYFPGLKLGGKKR